MSFKLVIRYAFANPGAQGWWHEVESVYLFLCFRHFASYQKIAGRFFVVRLRRSLGSNTNHDFDPFLSFDLQVGNFT